MALSMPYIIPLILGMTFDARYSRPGVSIYDDEYVNNPVNVTAPTSDSKYAVVTKMSDLLKTLDISGDLSLKIKSGMLDVKGAGSFLKNEKDIQKSVMILITFKYTAMTESFSSKAKPIEGWAKKFPQAALGTHYVSSITYGVDLIATAKFVAQNTSDLKDIKADVEAVIKPKGDAADLSAKGQLEMIEKRVGEKAKLEISYYGTLPLKNIPNSIEGLRDLIETFGQQVKDAGLENGIPRTVELSPLVEIADPEDREKFYFLKNEELMLELQEFENLFLELSSARTKLVNWAKLLPFDIDSEDKDAIGSLLEKINSISDKFYSTLWSMDLTKGPEQLDDALDAYGPSEYSKYNRQVNRLIKKVEAKVDKDAYAATDTYIHWGNSTCSGEKSIKLYDGYTISSHDSGYGGVSQYDCMPFKVASAYDIKEEKNFYSSLAAVRYTELERSGYPFKGEFAREISEKGIPCAKCYSLDAASITTFSAADTCPPTWNMKYKGFLMSARSDESQTTEYVCVDELPTKPLDVTFKDEVRNRLTFTQIRTGGALPDAFTNSEVLKCAVCSMRGQNYL